jgi:hypothetical protein
MADFLMFFRFPPPTPTILRGGGGRQASFTPANAAKVDWYFNQDTCQSKK